MSGAPDKKICWCFGYTRADIEADYRENGKSTIADKIAEELRRGTCRCEETNPKGG